MSRKLLQGKVVKKSGDKTISVEVVRKSTHKLYRKIISRKKLYAVHDENNSCVIGDFVKIMESAPISKRKTWFFVEELPKHI